jgi:carbon-monoxide dehydrogenase medium subunit
MGVSPLKPAPFSYHAPTGIDEALDTLAEHGDAAKIIAGGQSLIPMLALRLTAFEHLVDIGRIADLKQIATTADFLRIGAGVTEAAVGASPEVARATPLLSRATPLIGYFQIRNRGTLGGSIAHADPAAEYATVALTLDAQIEIRSASGTRTSPAEEFFTGFWTTCLEPEEAVVAVRFPIWGGRSGFAIEEFASRHRDFALAGATAAVTVDDAGRVTRCAIGLLSLGPTPLRASAAEKQVLGSVAGEIDAEELGRLAVADLDGILDDDHGPAEYRRRVGAAMVARAWTSAISEASNA